MGAENGNGFQENCLCMQKGDCRGSRSTLKVAAERFSTLTGRGSQGNLEGKEKLLTEKGEKQLLAGSGHRRRKRAYPGGKA